MTSKQSSAKPLLYTFFTGLKSGAIAPAAINMFIFLLVSPVFAAYTLLTTNNSYDEMGKMISQKGSELFRYLLFGEGDAFAILLLISAVAAGIFAAIFTFRFITSKKTVNVYYSLGITRDKLYFGKYAAGAVLLVLSIAIPFVITFFVNVFIVGFSEKLLYVTFFYILSYCATTLIAYSVTAAAFSAVGTFFEAGIFSFALLLFPTVFLTSLQTLMSRFLNGSPYGIYFDYANSGNYGNTAEKLFIRFINVNPLMFDYKAVSIWNALAKTTDTNPTLLFTDSSNISLSGFPSLTRAGCWLLVSIAVMFIGMYIFQKRKAEICGFIGTNKYFNTYTSFTYGFAVLCFFINLSSNNSSLSTLSAYIIGIGLFLLIYIVLELLLLRDVKAFLRGLWKLPAELAGAAVIIVVFATGLFGFSSRIPDTGNIEKAAVTVIGYESEYGFFTNSGNFSESDDFLYPGTVGLVDGFTTNEDIVKIQKLHEKLIALGKKEATPYSDTSVTDGNRVLPFTLQFAYTLKNGTVFKRNYNAATEDIVKAFLELDDTDFMETRLDKIFTEVLGENPITKTDYYQFTSTQKDEYYKHLFRGENNAVTLFGQNAVSGTVLSLTAAEKQQLAMCLYSDLKTRTVTEKYFPEINPLGILRFSYIGEIVNMNDYPFGPEIVTSDTTSVSDTTSSTSDTETSSLADASNTSETAATEPSTTEKETEPNNGLLRISPLSANGESSTKAETAEVLAGTTPSESAPDSTAATDITASTNSTTPTDNVGQTEATDKQIVGIPGNFGNGQLDLSGYPINLLGINSYSSANGLSVVLTSDMTNTIKFLKSKGLYAKLSDTSEYISAKVVAVVNLNANKYDSYWDRLSSRYFFGSHFMPVTAGGKQPEYYSGWSSIGTAAGYTTTSKSEIRQLQSAARFNYYNCTDSGYYVSFTDADNKTVTTMFIPYSLMPSGIKSKVIS